MPLSDKYLVEIIKCSGSPPRWYLYCIGKSFYVVQHESRQDWWKVTGYVNDESLHERDLKAGLYYLVKSDCSVPIDFKTKTRSIRCL